MFKSGFVILSLFCMAFLHWNALFSVIIGGATAVGVSYVQHGGLSKKPQGEKTEKAAAAPAGENQPVQQVQEKPAAGEKKEKPAFKEGEEPEHFHDNDELAEKAGVHRKKAIALRDEAHNTQDRERRNQLFEEANQEDATASKMIFDELQAKQPEGTIDLHLQYVAEAERICQEQAEILKGKGFQEMVVITGKGNHSEGGKCKIAPAIEKWANDHGYSQEPGEGKITVRF